MKIRFFGNRAGIPVPGPNTNKYGGNTYCFVVSNEAGQQLVINAGSGIRLASTLFQQNSINGIHLLLSQNHWDHIQGFPFFEPIYDRHKTLFIYPPDQNDHHETAIMEQMAKSFSATKFHQLPATITIKKTRFEGVEPVEVNGFNVQSIQVNHPEGGSAFKIEADGKTLIIVTNNELFAPTSHCFHEFEEWSLFCSGADLLLHDGRFMNHEMVNKIGQGHSCIDDAMKLATAAEIGMLGIIGHDPNTDDEMIDQITQSLFEQRPEFSFFFAKEGRTMYV
ncbi:MBL fold metallo-hydrolase [Psychrosphaera ytuae]|uniref:MBL fold metallo-hydrolase n=1 Tax=Psychrosphaera ytuae TaxID=2820710 RepID=A0A975D963_9GAMM|nr:MBL fold metallo-hydrolase [Psychrosphaera ytuae]QTH62628.1 MBL fold metallo-hydrolase [Psychrosphaera ytuae]